MLVRVIVIDRASNLAHSSTITRTSTILLRCPCANPPASPWPTASPLRCALPGTLSWASGAPAKNTDLADLDGVYWALEDGPVRVAGRRIMGKAGMVYPVEVCEAQ